MVDTQKVKLLDLDLNHPLHTLGRVFKMQLDLFVVEVSKWQQNFYPTFIVKYNEIHMYSSYISLLIIDRNKNH